VFADQGAGAWVLEDTITPPGPYQNPSAFPRFGCAIEMEGNWMWVGARGGNDPALSYQGKCHLFHRQATGSWTEQAQMRYSDRDPTFMAYGASMGARVAADFDNGQLMASASDYRRWGAGGQASGLAVCGGAYLFDLELGDRFCAGTTNSSGAEGVLAVIGSLEVTLNHLRLHAHHLPPGEFALCLYGQESAPVPLLSGGALCILGGPVQRLFPVLTSGSGGEVYYDVDLQAPSEATRLLPGSTWSFQVWHRDHVGGASVTGTTSAMRVTLE